MIESHTPAFWRATLALCLGSFMIFANLYTTQPLLPMLAGEFGISPLQASWSLMAATLTLGLSLLIYGPLSDALGRRGIMILTMAGMTLTTLLLAWVESFTALIALRALQGFFLGGLPAVAIAYMGEEFNKRALILAVGFYISANSLGGISGRVIGGFGGETLGWSDTFLLMAMLNLVLLTVFVYLLPASTRFRARKLRLRRVTRNLARHLANPLLLLAYLIGGFNFFIFVNQYSYATFLLADAPYHLSPTLLGLLFLTYLAGTVSSAISGHVAGRLSQPLCMALGIGLMMMGSLITLIPHLHAIVAGFLFSAFGFFFTQSTASSWVSHKAEFAKASSSSLYLLFYYLGASLGGFYLDPFWHWLGWEGVVAGSLLVLSGTLWAALRLQRIESAMPDLDPAASAG